MASHQALRFVQLPARRWFHGASLGAAVPARGTNRGSGGKAGRDRFLSAAPAAQGGAGARDPDPGATDPHVCAMEPDAGVRDHDFSTNEVARLFHVLSDPENGAALRRESQPLFRAELEKERVSPWT